MRNHRLDAYQRAYKSMSESIPNAYKKQLFKYHPTEMNFKEVSTQR